MRFRLVAFAAVVFAAPTRAQQRVYTSDDYARAERFMNYNTTPLVFGTVVRGTWLPDDRFWFRDASPSAADLIIVDPARRSRLRVFDEPRLAGAVTTAIGASARGAPRAGDAERIFPGRPNDHGHESPAGP